jgi:hypothetical protein
VIDTCSDCDTELREVKDERLFACT